MTSKVWPPPNEVEQAQLDDAADNPFQEECESCGCYPCTCNLCGDCECDPCECDTCSMCGCVECECPDCYVMYHTTVRVHVDYEGDVVSVAVDSALGEPYDVVNEDGQPIGEGPIRTRALTNSAERDWPSWDIA